MRRDLKHFDCWLRATFEATIDAPLPLAFICKAFFLSHIALYPSTVTRDRFLPDDLVRDLQHMGLMDANALSCRQVSARILSVIRWQHYKFKADTHELMRELIPFYRELCEVTRNQELTYKSTLQSEMILKIIRRYPTPGPQPDRDLVILLMTWVLGCSPDELVQLSFDCVEALGPLDWVYFRPNTENAPVKLDHMTALSILSLVCENFALMGYYPDTELNCRDGLTWRPLTESDVDVILERHYRYAEALYGFDRDISPFQRPTPLRPEEEALWTDALKITTEEIFAVQRQSSADADEEDHDWDAAVRRKAGRHRPAEHESGADEDE